MIAHTTIQALNSKHELSLAYDASADCNKPNTSTAPICQQQQEYQDSCEGHESIRSSQKQQLSLYRSLLQQLDTLSWSRVASVSETLRSITLQLSDASQRLHTAIVKIPTGFPDVAPSVDISLPKPFKLKWVPGHTLVQVVRQVEEVLDAYQMLWEQLEDLDQHTQLLDHQETLTQPYSNCTRCIALGNGAGCQVRLSAVAPRSLPSVTFHGPSSVTAGLQNLWYGSAHSVWDEARSVRSNLEATLQLHLPAPKPGSKKGCAAVHMLRANVTELNVGDTAVNNTSDDAGSSDNDSDMDGKTIDDVGACVICYAVYLPNPEQPHAIGVAADVECSSCKRLFHARCLAEWLGALPDSRRVFDTLFGNCPFCNSPIGVSMLTARE